MINLPAILVLGFIALLSIVLFGISAKRYTDITVTMSSGIRPDKLVTLLRAATKDKPYRNLYYPNLDTNTEFVRTYLSGDMNYAWSCTILVITQSVLLGFVLYRWVPQIDNLANWILVVLAIVFIVLRIVLSFVALIKVSKFKRERDRINDNRSDTH